MTSAGPGRGARRFWVPVWPLVDLGSSAGVVWDLVTVCGGLGRLWRSVGLQEGSYLGFWIPAWPLVKQEASSGFVGLDIGTGDF